MKWVGSYAQVILFAVFLIVFHVHDPLESSSTSFLWFERADSGSAACLVRLVVLVTIKLII